MSERVKLCSLWKNKTKDGKEYLAGYLGDSKIMVFPNGYKTEEKHPDFNVYLVPKKQPEEKKDYGASFPKNEGPPPEQPQGDNQSVEDIPF